MRKKVFLSYRRKGSGAGFALTLFNDLQRLLGPRAVFMDVAEGSIERGEDWVERIRKEVETSSTLLVIIDNEWAHGLANVDDPVRFELETAFAAGVHIVPVLVGSAPMPERKALPDSLADFPRLNAHEIRPSSSPADTRNLLRAITGRDPAKPGIRADRIDVLVVGCLFLLGFFAWLSWGRHTLDVPEMWLWGGVLAWLAVTWYVTRRAVRAVRFEQAGWRAVLARLLPLAILAFAGVYFAYTVYRIPRFTEDETGILLTRLRDDPGHANQAALQDALTQVVATKDLSGLRVLTVRREADSASATSYGSRAGATVVLWGETAASELRVLVTFLGTRGIFGAPGVASRATAGLSLRAQDVAVSGDLDALVRVIPLLVAGYQAYQEATDSVGFVLAAKYLDNALGEAEGVEVPTDQRTALGAALSTLHLFRANALYLSGDDETARVEYETAIELSLDPVTGTPDYIEPVNNLAQLLAANGMVEEALGRLRLAENSCSRDVTSIGCGYVSYNFGNLLLDQAQEYEDYEAASEHFQDVLAQVQRSDETGLADQSDYRLLGFAYQNLAFVETRLAALEQDSTRASEHLNSADSLWWRGRQTIEERAGLLFPIRFQLTRARIQLERGDFTQALATVSELEPDEASNPQLHIVRAAAHRCAGDARGLTSEMSLFLQATIRDERAKWEGLGEFSRLEKVCP